MKSMQKFYLKLFICIGFALTLMNVSKVFPSEIQPKVNRAENPDTQCDPTPADYLGPFYTANAPVRSSVGHGYLLKGMVKSSADCAPIANAAIELWLTGPDGSYDDHHRATIYSTDSGQYRFESNFPPGYSGRPPHIHIRVSANGFKTLATQHYPTRGQTSGEFDIVLVPTGP